LRFSRKQQDESVSNFFQDLEKNTCLLQPALKSNALGLNLFTLSCFSTKISLLEIIII